MKSTAFCQATETHHGLDFSGAGVVVYDPQGNSMPVLRDALRHLGFRKIVARRNLSQLQEDLGSAHTNLVVVDIDHEPTEALGLVRDIRFRRAGADPFVSVLALSWGVEKQNMPDLLNSGTDDVLIKPMSFESVRARLYRLVRSRKPFVGAPRYIGPDRRSPERSATETIKLLKVPNTLRDKALRSERTWSPCGVEETYRALSMQQVQRMGVEIREAARRREKDVGTPADDAWRAEMLGLRTAITDLNAHLEGQGYEDMAGMLGTATEAVEHAMSTETPTARQLDVLRLHGDSLLAIQRSANVDARALESGLRQAAAVVRKGGSASEIRPAA